MKVNLVLMNVELIYTTLLTIRMEKPSEIINPMEPLNHVINAMNSSLVFGHKLKQGYTKNSMNVCQKLHGNMAEK
jgi:hypothetical protein